MAAPKVSFVAAYELSSQFVYDGAAKTFKVKTVSSDAGNLLGYGSDGVTAFLGASAVQAVQSLPTITHDTANHQLVFDDGAGHITNIPVAWTSTEVTGLSLSGTVLTLTESNGGTPDTIDLGAFMQVVSATNTSAIKITGDGKTTPLTVALYVDPTVAGGNLLKVTATGAKVDPADIVTLLNAATTNGLALDPVAGVLTSTVNGHAASVNLVQLCDSAGTVKAYGMTT